jgi:hypothetical protein
VTQVEYPHDLTSYDQWETSERPNLNRLLVVFAEAPVGFGVCDQIGLSLSKYHPGDTLTLLQRDPPKGVAVVVKTSLLVLSPPRCLVDEFTFLFVKEHDGCIANIQLIQENVEGVLTGLFDIQIERDGLGQTTNERKFSHPL